jgi:opacity protein-like surface antigen
MKMTLACPKLLFVSGTLLACALPAVGQSTRFYVKGDLGGNITTDTSLNEFFGPVAPNSKVKFDPGFRAGIAGGYQLCDWFAPEVEVGFMENKINSITGADILHNSWFASVPFLVNGKLQYPNSSPVTPYAGAGVGFSEALLSVDHLDIGGTSLHGDMHDTVFAWQAFAGLRFRLNDTMGLSVEYRYFRADPASWQAEFTSGTASDTLRMGRTETHAISLAFDFRF